MTLFFSFNNHHKVQLASLLIDKALVTMPPEYFKFANIFSSKSTAKLLKHTSINNYTIDLVKC